MSSIIAHLTPKVILLLTDSLVHTRNEGVIFPNNFCAKTFFLPQFNSCFAGQGSLNFLNRLFCFAQERVIANDVYSFVQQISRSQTMEIIGSKAEHEESTIFAFGLTSNSDNLQTHKIVFATNAEPVVTQIEQNNLIYKPDVGDLTKFLNQIGSTKTDPKPTIESQLCTLMKMQQAADNKLEVEKRSVIGGRVQVTYLNSIPEDGFLVQTRMVEVFDDSKNLYAQMLSRAK